MTIFEVLSLLSRFLLGFKKQISASPILAQESFTCFRVDPAGDVVVAHLPPFTSRVKTLH